MVGVDRDRLEADPRVPLTEGPDHCVGLLLSGAPILLRGLELPGEEGYGVHSPDRTSATLILVALLESGANCEVGRVLLHVKRAVRFDDEELQSLSEEFLRFDEGTLRFRRPHKALRLLTLRFALGDLQKVHEGGRCFGIAFEVV